MINASKRIQWKKKKKWAQTHHYKYNEWSIDIISSNDMVIHNTVSVELNLEHGMILSFAAVDS